MNSMKEVVDWLIIAEGRAFSAYSRAADFFHADEELSGILRQLAEDEKMHQKIIMQAYEIMKDTPDWPPLTAYPGDETKQSFRKYLSKIENGIEEGTITGNDIIDCIITLEYCEWNDVFAYIVNTLMGKHEGFRSVAVKMHHHRKAIERYIDSHAEYRKFLDRISRIPDTWEEKILIVDDEPMVIDVIQAILSKEGIIETAVNGKTALEKVKEKYYAVIISDVNMPVMDGVDFYKKAVELYPPVKKRFIFFSGRPDEKTSDFIKQNGLRFIQKPSRMQDIRKTIIEILSAV